MFGILCLLLNIQSIELINYLGDPDYVVRERYTKTIIDMGYNGLSIAKMATNSIDPEIRMRGELIISNFFNPPRVLLLPGIHGFHELKPFVLPSGATFNPSNIAQIYWKRVGGDAGYDKYLLTYASRLLIQDLRSLGTSWEDIEEILSRANQNDLYDQFRKMIGEDIEQNDD